MSNCLCNSVIINTLPTIPRNGAPVSQQIQCKVCGRIYAASLAVLHETEWTEERMNNYVERTGNGTRTASK